MRTTFTIFLGMLLLFTIGCSGNSLDLTPVGGTVTYQGKPLPRGRIIFTLCDATPGPQAIGKIGPDGTFQMKTVGKNGAVVGRHHVTVICREEMTKEQKMDLNFTPKWLIPKIYATQEQSPLYIDVKAGQSDYPILLK